MIIGLTGAAGSGKDSVADILVAEHGFQRIAFADCLYEEVSAAFSVPVELLKCRETKESPTPRLALGRCTDKSFRKTAIRVCGVLGIEILWRWKWWSPRQILQWWGDYRRAQCESYLIDKVRDRILSTGEQVDWVITDVRSQNEADLVQELGGQLGLVLRPGVEPVANHVSEEFWQTCSSDIAIKNDGTVEDLVNTVNAMVPIWYDACFGTFIERDGLPESLPATSSIPKTGVVADDSWTLADTIQARKILLNLGYAMHPSMEPGADERVDRIAKMLADAKAEANLQTQSFDLVAHLHRQREFSLRTFGPGERAAGVLDHIRKELVEIEADPKDIIEWVDVILLALDGAWRSGHTPEEIAQAITDKQSRNEAREWPDWRTAEPGMAIEHVR